MDEKTRRREILLVKWITYTLFFLFLIYSIIQSDFSDFLSDREKIQELLFSSGSVGPIILTLLHIIESVIFFLPGPFVSFAGGYVYGVWLGTFLNIIGTTIGSTILFYLSRWIGKKLFSKYLKQKEYANIKKQLEKHGVAALLFARLIPIFPNDLVTMAAGISPIKSMDFIIVSFIGYLPTLYIENLFGAQLHHGLTIENILIALLMIVLGLIYVYRKKIKKKLF